MYRIAEILRTVFRTLSSIIKILIIVSTLFVVPRLQAELAPVNVNILNPAWSPYLYQDLQSGEMKGIVYKLLQNFAKNKGYAINFYQAGRKVSKKLPPYFRCSLASYDREHSGEYLYSSLPLFRLEYGLFVRSEDFDRISKLSRVELNKFRWGALSGFIYAASLHDWFSELQSLQRTDREVINLRKLVDGALDIVAASQLDMISLAKQVFDPRSKKSLEGSIKLLPQKFENKRYYLACESRLDFAQSRAGVKLEHVKQFMYDLDQFYGFYRSTDLFKESLASYIPTEFKELGGLFLTP